MAEVEEEDCSVHLVDAELYAVNNLAPSAAAGENTDDKPLLIIADWWQGGLKERRRHEDVHVL